ncbi:hypothetical protein [uncultured Flavobacterium sp.]|jgi:hypothetical protein|uniref:hypothetical protein n=1 Tax=uncultured Flavobacterium sp. TaxID=165435 RepID=UPI0025978374|nr:hypothetical protein [uncultured Flavobacterium sp.]
MKNTLLILLFALTLNTTFSQKIDKSKKELNAGSSSSSSSSSSSLSSSSSRSSSSSNDFGLVGLLAEGFLYVGFYSTIGDYRNEDHLYNSLSKYPYFDGESGNFVRDGDSILRNNKMRFDIENHFLYSSNTSFGNHLKAKIRPFQYFYLQADYRELIEKNIFTNEYDNLSMFQFNFAYDRIRFKKFNIGWTLGATYIGNEVNKAGISYGLNTDVFAFKNISFNGAFQLSKINGLSVNSFEFRGKYHKKNYFFSAGYEHLKIASPSYNFITIGAGIYF